MGGSGGEGGSVGVKGRREEGERGRYLFDDGLVVLAFGRGGLGAGGEGEQVCADFVVGEDGGLGLEDLGVGGWVLVLRSWGGDGGWGGGTFIVGL
jgi:hypothetical protein